MTFEPNTEYMKGIHEAYRKRQIFYAHLVDYLILLMIFFAGIALLIATDYHPPKV